MTYFVYILFSASLGRFYVGQTQNLEERILLHNSGRNKSTKAGIPWKIIYFETCSDRTEAVTKEAKIKNLGSKRYLQMIGKVFDPEQPGSLS